MEQQTKTWTHPITGETETVIVGSDRDKELTKQLNDAGLYEKGDPNTPEGCMSIEEFFKQHREETEERFKSKL